MTGASAAHVGRPVVTKSLEECEALGEVYRHCFPAFGGKPVGQAHEIIHEAISKGVPLVLAIAGPVTVTDFDRACIIPLLKTGWIAYVVTTDANCYHDGHEALSANSVRPFQEVEFFGDDAAYREAGIIRVGDVGFHEKLLFDQDRFLTTVLQMPEFQHPMTTTERNARLGAYYRAQEEKVGAPPGLLRTCADLGIPVFVGAAGDGSIALNAAKLWFLRQSDATITFSFAVDLWADIIESAAYHLWGLRDSDAKALGIIIFGGGVPKNYALQPEPFLSQILLLDNIRGYDYDVQIVSAPVTDGSLSSCHPAEAVTWGKVNPEVYRRTTVSIHADYTQVLPPLLWALLKDHDLPRRPPLRLFDKRAELIRRLGLAVWAKRPALVKTLLFPLPPVPTKA